jgi:predicted small integral membrane protein
MAIRACKIALTAAVAFYFSLVVLDNLTDYWTNFAYVQNVMSMSTVFPDSALRWRAMKSPFIHHAFYVWIIAWETLAAVLCWLGALRLLRAIRADAAHFNRAKSLAVVGLVVGCLLWLAAFLCVGDEWFEMWQSAKWNGQTTACRMFTVMGIVLLFVHLPDPER